MQSILMLGTVVVFIAVIIVSRMTDDELVKRLSFVKSQDKPLKNWQFLVAIALLIVIEAVIFHYMGFELIDYVIVLILSAYLPVTYLMYCNIFHVGPRRELIWAGMFFDG